MEIILELILEIPLQMLAEVGIKITFLTAGFFFGFFLVLFSTLCAIEPGPIRHCDDGGAFYRSQGMKLWHITYSVDGKRYLPAETVALVGWGFIGLTIAFSCFIGHVVGQ